MSSSFWYQTSRNRLKNYRVLIIFIILIKTDCFWKFANEAMYLKWYELYLSISFDKFGIKTKTESICFPWHAIHKVKFMGRLDIYKCPKTFLPSVQYSLMFTYLLLFIPAVKQVKPMQLMCTVRDPCIRNWEGRCTL